MNSRVIFLAAVLLVSLLAGCSSMPAPVTPPKTAALPGIAGGIGRNLPEPALQKGMTAETVRRQLGEPAETKPLASLTGRAEVWTYHRIIGERVCQVPTGMKLVPVYKGPDCSTSIKLIQEPVYRQEKCALEAEIKLLMFEGRLVAWKSIVQEQRAYN